VTAKEANGVQELPAIEEQSSTLCSRCGNSGAEIVYGELKPIVQPEFLTSNHKFPNVSFQRDRSMPVTMSTPLSVPVMVRALRARPKPRRSGRVGAGFCNSVDKVLRAW
jgi:hypothetical protein